MLNEELLADDADLLLSAEAQFVRCIVQTPESLCRLYAVAIWCWLVARLGFEKEALTIMCLGDDIGQYHLSQPDQPVFLAEYFMSAYEHQRKLDDKWMVLVREVLRTRKQMRGLAKDVVVCHYHAPFMCPKYVRAVEMSAEEKLCADKVSETRHDSVWKGESRIRAPEL
jgi:hypothetical protein